MIGVGIITCNREEFFHKCLKSIPKCDHLIVVNDGQAIDYKGEMISHYRKGVGVSKNDALKYLIEKGCDDIFLIEDDMEIIREDVFEKYIEAGKKTGIEHFNFGFHGGLNFKFGAPNPRITERNGFKFFVNDHLVGSFSYYTKNCIERIGFFDESFYNALEHIDHTYRVCLAGLTTPFWHFADLYESYNYIKEQAGIEASVIRKENLDEIFSAGLRNFYKKYGITLIQIPREKL